MRFVYLIKAGNWYKVGVATDLNKRIKTLQTSNGKKINLVCARRTVRANELEKSIHEFLQEFSGEGGREWFSLTPQQAIMVAIKINTNPEVDTADLIIEGLRVDLPSIVEQYWRKLDQVLDNKPPAIVKVVYPPDKPAINDDQIYEKARQLVLDSDKASTSLLQRKLGMGYGRAARLMDRLEKEGIISSSDGIKPRTILTKSSTNSVLAEVVAQEPM